MADFFVCSLVAERSRSAEHFTEKSRISAALNDRDFFVFVETRLIASVPDCVLRLYRMLIFL